MKKLFINVWDILIKVIIGLIIVLLKVYPVYAVEFLVKADNHWMDSLTQIDVDKMIIEEKEAYLSRLQIGDIIVIRPDGWPWGKEESLPRFVIIKVPDMTIQEAMEFEESLVENDKIVRLRKYNVPISFKENIVIDKITFMENILIKTGDSQEVLQPVSTNMHYFFNVLAKKISEIITPSVYGATQLLKTVKPSGGDYTTLQSCISANTQDLVTNDKWFDIEIDGTWSAADTTAVNVTGYTTDATRYINIYTTTAARHQGYWSTNYYHLSTGGSNTPTLKISNNFVTVTGLQAKHTSGTSSNYHAAFYIAATNLTMKKDIAYANAGPAIYGEVDRANIMIQNSFAISTSNSGIRLSGKWSDAPSQQVLNSVAVSEGSGNGIMSVTYAITVKNCYAYSASGNDYGINTNKTTCAAADTTGEPSSLDSIGYSTSSGAYFINVTSGSENFHIGSSSSLKDAGTDLSSTFTDDIDGQTRINTWDVGVDEIIDASRRIMLISKNEFKEGYYFDNDWFIPQEAEKCKIGNRWETKQKWNELGYKLSKVN